MKSPQLKTNCPNPGCPDRAQDAPFAVTKHSFLKTKSGTRRRYSCASCRKTFAATTGTVYERMRKSKSDFDKATHMQSEGMTKAAIARVLKVSPSTVTRWLAKAGKHAEEFHQENVRLPEAVEVQLDELRCKGTGEAKNAWAYSGVEVWSRFWATLTVGNRTLRNTLLFARQLRIALIGESKDFLVTSDSFKYYEPVMRRVFGKTPLVYVQVKNHYWRKGIRKSEKTLVLGTPDQLEDAMARSEDSKKPNTAYIERLNLHKRMSCSMLRRRTPAPGRSAERIQEALELVRVFYNFVTPHGSLKFGKVKRTPAMQAGIFDRPLTIREIFNWVPPTRPKWGRKAMVQMATEY